MDVPEDLLDRVRTAADRGPATLRTCWAELAAELGTEAASRVWQEAFAALDAEQQT